jgi:hypothetical protein
MPYENKPKTAKAGDAPGLEFDADRKELRVNLVNLSAVDARFLSGVIAIFADPSKAALANHLRRGVSHIRFSGAGYARVCDDVKEN